MKANADKFYRKHFLGLSALFVLGNTVITTPQINANEFSFLGFLVAGVVTLVVYLLVYLLPFNKITAVMFCLLALCSIGDAGVSFVRFIHKNLLPETKPFFIVLPFVLVLIFIAFKPKEMLFKFSLVSFLPVVAVILFFFFSTLKDFKAQNIFIYELPNLKVFYNQTLPYIKSVALPCALLAFFSKLSYFKKSYAISGFLIGLVLLGITILNSVLLFGIEFSGVLDYPYSSAGSTVTFGNLFTRMDGFLYFVYLVSCIVKCSVSIFVIKKSRNLFVP